LYKLCKLTMIAHNLLNTKLDRTADADADTDRNADADTDIHL